MQPTPDTDLLDVKVTPLSPALGAEISGVDLKQPLSAREVAAIKDAWDKHLVLVFRDQDLSQDDQLRFASYFGELGSRRKAPAKLASRAEGVLQDHEKILLVSNIKIDGEAIGAFGDGEFWFHINSGYTARPYKYTFLFALELPSEGGHTLFSNMYKAYDAVPAELKRKLKGKRALHIHEYNRNRQASHAGDISRVPHHYHPVFTRHPDTGRKSLFVDRLMTTSIEGFSDGRKCRDPEPALRHRRAARVHLRACLALGRLPDVGQSLHHPCADRFPQGRASAAETLRGRRRRAEGITQMAERLPAFESFIRELRAVWAAEADDRARMERAKPLLERLVMDAGLKAHSADWPSTEGRKNLRLYVDPDYGFVINAVVRVPGTTRQRARSCGCVGALRRARR